MDPPYLPFKFEPYAFGKLFAMLAFAEYEGELKLCVYGLVLYIIMRWLYIKISSFRSYRLVHTTADAVICLAVFVALIQKFKTPEYSLSVAVENLQHVGLWLCILDSFYVYMKHKDMVLYDNMSVFEVLVLFGHFENRLVTYVTSFIMKPNGLSLHTYSVETIAYIEASLILSLLLYYLGDVAYKQDRHRMLKFKKAIMSIACVVHFVIWIFMCGMAIFGSVYQVSSFVLAKQAFPSLNRVFVLEAFVMIIFVRMRFSLVQHDLLKLSLVWYLGEGRTLSEIKTIDEICFNTAKDYVEKNKIDPLSDHVLRSVILEAF